MKTNLRITKFLLLCVSAYILIPRIANCANSFSALAADGSSVIVTKSLTLYQVNYQNSNDTFIPPNNGGPDSQHGSGTR